MVHPVCITHYRLAYELDKYRYALSANRVRIHCRISELKLDLTGDLSSLDA